MAQFDVATPVGRRGSCDPAREQDLVRDSRSDPRLAKHPGSFFAVLTIILLAVLVNAFEFKLANSEAERRYQALNQEKTLKSRKLVREPGGNRRRFMWAMAMAKCAPQASLILPRSIKGLLGEYLLFGNIAAYRIANYDPVQLRPNLDKHVLKRVKSAKGLHRHRELRIVAKGAKRRKGCAVARGREFIFVRHRRIDAFVDTALIADELKELDL